MANGILFPDNATQILAAVLKVRLNKDLEVLLVRRIDIRGCISELLRSQDRVLTKERLRGEENKLVGSDAKDIAILAQGILNRPRVSPREPRVRVRFLGGK